MTRHRCTRCFGYDRHCSRCEGRRLARKHGGEDDQVGEDERSSPGGSPAGLNAEADDTMAPPRERGGAVKAGGLIRGNADDRSVSKAVAVNRNPPLPRGDARQREAAQFEAEP